MTTRRLAAALVILGAALGVTACASQPPAEPIAAPTAASSPSAGTPSTDPTPETVEATCENTSTDDWHAAAAQNDWVSWSRADGSGWPFQDFPGGAPSHLLACTWGADPELATDNVVSFAWASLEADAAAAAQAQLEADGYERIESPEGVYLAMKADGQEAQPSPDGYVQSYLFTDTDVRWSGYKDDLQYVKAPDEVG